MRTIGLIGGTSWLSTVEYYRIINQQVNERLGGANSGKILLYSVNKLPKQLPGRNIKELHCSEQNSPWSKSFLKTSF